MLRVLLARARGGLAVRFIRPMCIQAFMQSMPKWCLVLQQDWATKHKVKDAVVKGMRADRVGLG
jgi:hypothetical protein